MPEDLRPEDVVGHLEKGKLAPFYLFHGQSQFRREKVLNKIREIFIPEQARDFNLQIFYGEKAGTSDKTTPADIIDSVQTLPFMTSNRLVIVRRAENFTASELESFIPYIDDPVKSTCLIFLSSKPNFNMKFYRKIRGHGRAVNFKKLYDNQIVPWIKRTAKELNIDIEDKACAYLMQIVGNGLMDLHSELEKLGIRYKDTSVGIEEVKELAINSRIYTNFELMDKISFKQCAESVSVLNRFLEEEGNDAAFGVLGMLNRQMRLLWQAKSIVQGGGRAVDVARKIRLPINLTRKITQQSRLWSIQELEGSFNLLYQADGLVKSGSRVRLVLENVVLSLCA